jgi:hypothetical protein
VKDKDFKSLITQMLAKNPLTRLCKISHIKANPWFSGFSWENLISLDIPVPYTPKFESKDNEETKLMPYLTRIKVIEK